VSDAWFDARLHARGLRARDLEDLAFFEIAGVLLPSGEPPPGGAAAIRREWEALAGAVRRLRRGGLAAWAALGIHPRRIPLRGLEALLAGLPELLGRPEVAALGDVGLDRGGELEERILSRQLELARELRLPVLVTVPARARERLTRRALALLREAEVEPASVLVAPAEPRTVRMIRACGFHAGMWLSDGGEPERGIEAAVRAVSSLGPEGLVLGSDAGLGGGDLLAVARAADRLSRAGLSDAVVRRVCGENAVAWLGVELPLRRARR
jgi:predicted metal-dependent TIM-barrel fold hydrolase